jgi:tetratricopeptide (TPR) repeat protein
MHATLFWDNLTGSDESIADKLKYLGNKAFVSKRFTDAIRWYNLALDYALPEQTLNIVRNKSAVLLNLRCYNTALECADQVLESDPDRVKAIYRRSKALIGLLRYKDALDYLQQSEREDESLIKLTKDAVKMLSDQ